MFFQSEGLSSAMDARLLVWLVLQVTLVAMVTYSVVVLAGRATPASRAVVCLLGLGCMTALPIASLLQFYEWSWGQWLQATPSIAAATVVEQPAPLRAVVDPPGEQVEPLQWWQEKLLVAGGLFSDVGDLEPRTSAAPRGPSVSSAVTTWLPVVLACSVALGAGRLLLGLWLVRRLRNASVPLDDPQLEAELDHCARQMGMAAGVSLAISHEIGTPAVVGWRTPLLLLPTTWRTWTAEERQAVLAHELAHVQRDDYMLTAVAQAAVALHFFHPLAHALVSRLRLDQELAADGLAANLVGGSQRYVEILAGLALRQPAARTPGPAQAFLPPRRMFVRRLEMLRSQNFGDRAWSRLYATAASCAVIALTLMASGLRPIAATAQETLTKRQPVATSAAAVADDDLLKLIPPTVVEAVVDIDVSAVLQSSVAEQFLAAAPDILNWLPFDIETLERAIVLISAEESNQTSPAVVLLQFSEGTALPIGDEAPAGTTATPQQEFAAATRKINARTLVVTGNQAMRDMIGVFQSDDFYRPLLDRQGNKAIRIAGRMDEIRKRFSDTNNTALSKESPMWVFAPLWEDVSTVSLSIQIDDKLQIEGQLDSSEPQAVVDTLTAAKILANNYLNRVSDARTKSNGPALDAMERMLMTTAINKAKELLGSMRLQTNEPSIVAFTAHLEAGSEAGLSVMLPAIAAARAAALRTQSANNLKQLLLALHNYHDTYNHLPPVVIRDATTGVERSWRVEILPYLEGGQELFNQYRKDESWDSPANLAVLKQMPAVFAFPGNLASADTPYQAIASQDGGLTLTDEGKPPRFLNTTDGTSNTVFLVETKPMVPWTKPIDVMETVQVRAVAMHKGGFQAGFGDGSVRFIANSIDQAIWTALTTRSGAEVIGSISNVPQSR